MEREQLRQLVAPRGELLLPLTPSFYIYIILINAVFNISSVSEKTDGFTAVPAKGGRNADAPLLAVLPLPR